MVPGFWQLGGQGPGRREAGLDQGMEWGTGPPEKSWGEWWWVVSVAVGLAAAAHDGESLLMSSHPMLRLSVPLQPPRRWVDVRGEGTRETTSGGKD